MVNDTDVSFVLNPKGRRLYYSGPDIKEGKRPTVIFFALSAESSLYQDPLNQPIRLLSQQHIRTFSWDLPFHGNGEDPREAMYKWAIEFAHNPHFLNNFIQESLDNIDFLIKENLIDTTHLGVAGISRGAFIATHLAAHDDRIATVLGFAPLTHPKPVEELSHLKSQIESASLFHLAPKLIDKHLRFYIGNDDQRVGTEDCFRFIKHLTEVAVQANIRSPQTELIIYPSIGYKGHGTPSSIFHDGALWLTSQLLT